MSTKSLPTLLAVCAILITSCSQPIASDKSELSEAYENIEFEMSLVKEPSISDNTVNLKDFGAIRAGEKE